MIKKNWMEIHLICYYSAYLVPFKIYFLLVICDPFCNCLQWFECCDYELVENDNAKMIKPIQKGNQDPRVIENLLDVLCGCYMFKNNPLITKNDKLT